MTLARKIYSGKLLGISSQMEHVLGWNLVVSVVFFCFWYLLLRLFLLYTLVWRTLAKFQQTPKKESKIRLETNKEFMCIPQHIVYEERRQKGGSKLKQGRYMRYGTLNP